MKLPQLQGKVFIDDFLYHIEMKSDRGVMQLKIVL